MTPDLTDLLTRMNERLERIEAALRLAPRPAEPTAPPPPPAPLLLTIPEASKVVGIGVDTLRSWVASGRLPRRTKGAARNPKRPTFLVNVEEIKAAAAGSRRWN